MKYHTLAIVALIAVAGSLTPSANALPLNSGVLSDSQDVEHVVEDMPRLQKRQIHLPTPTGQEPKEPTSSARPRPTPPPASPKEPQPTSAPRPDPSSTANPPPPTPPKPSSSDHPAPRPTSSSPSKPSSSHGGDKDTKPSPATTATASGKSPVVSPTRSTTPEDGAGVPTKVSDKVFIGLGTVGGLLIFALGGVAFCRHRKKKNLATALLQQTAQFNHNNPYAKISESTKAPKESLPMTPTKPLGTYNVVAIYTPALADEIEIGLGDTVTILQEYDDGWCMGINNTRNCIKGVFPRHCLEGGQYDESQYGGDGPGYYPPNPGFKAMANKRMSSIPAGGWNNGYNGGGGGGYGDYPPSPHYDMGSNNNGPPHQGYYNNAGY
ncbi:hypothetical protein BG011_009986 [Mortierella polycephala]|uniref:SH3 domain-containing protein n=1 Tax=Mortierella polycephala TaxID=41804 RepID=A0A9P6PNA6_9FUNG|nr:hypothetical protein BG011_009986 [Mortierella polycephala]